MGLEKIFRRKIHQTQFSFLQKFFFFFRRKIFRRDLACQAEIFFFFPPVRQEFPPVWNHEKKNQAEKKNFRLTSGT
jgi:hypothetical protein